jgi:hypothetical protein
MLISALNMEAIFFFEPATLHGSETCLWQRRMASSGMLRRVALVRTDVSEELSPFIIKVTRIGELGTLVVTSTRRTLLKNISSETSVLTRATRHNIPKDAILHSTTVKTSNLTRH